MLPRGWLLRPCVCCGQHLPQLLLLVRMLRGQEQRLRTWASVLTTQNSTPCSLPSFMRLTALDPPPPTPTTCEAPGRIHGLRNIQGRHCCCYCCDRCLP
jgi:hypothetical protein